MSKKGKYSAQELCEIFSEANKIGGGEVMRVYRERQLVADKVEIRNHPPRKSNNGTQPGINWIDFECGTMRLVEEYMKNSKEIVLDPEACVPVKTKAWAVGDFIFDLEEYEKLPGQEERRTVLVKFPVVDGKIGGYETWVNADPDPKMDSLLYDMEIKVRETIPFPDQTGIVFDNKPDKETLAIIKKIGADLKDGNTRGGGQGLVAALRKYAADEVNICHHPLKKYVDGKTTGKRWLDFEEALNGMLTKASEDMKPVETWFITMKLHIICQETRVFHQPDGSKKTCRYMRVWPVVHGKITGYDAFYDPLPGEVSAAIEAMEAKARKIIPLPKQV